MRAAALFLTLGISIAPAVSAQESALTPFRVQFAGALHCGTSAGFSEELLERSGYVRPADAGEEGFSFEIALEEQQGVLYGRLALREPGGRVTVRSVSGATCGEVVSALAVIAAVLVEPGAPAERPEPPAMPPAPSEPTGWGVGANVGLSLQDAVAPELRPAWGVEANLVLEVGTVVSPLFALAYGRTLSAGEAPTPNGTAQLEWWTVRASLCPVRWPERGRLAARPCGLFDVGQIEGTGIETEQERSASITWVAPGASARLDVTPIDGFWLTGEAGLLVPLNRDQFVFDPGFVAFRPPGAGGMARLALGGRFQ